jgi:hypothetical protein
MAWQPSVATHRLQGGQQDDGKLQQYFLILHWYMVETQNVDGFLRPNSKSNVSSKFQPSKTRKNDQTYGRNLAQFAVQQGQAAGHGTVRRQERVVQPLGQTFLYIPVVTIYTTSLTFSNSTFCPHSVFMCFVWISAQTAIISLYNINWLVFITETECVYCAVRTACL